MLRHSRSAVVRRRCVARKMRSMATTAVAELRWSSAASSTRNRGDSSRGVDQRFVIVPIQSSRRWTRRPG